ncbi:response regulator transcription factor [Corynebacterium uterequi]|uniref:Two-component system response regulator n=1 Tax=Corynebacterium uterequi TaxID=1072256 RepID=A0A0G3HIH7_9CORY|nr:response regulator transcription factor [Corynebacterium uterequi]AKK10962.1 two-component system response regulator [Corynebacterium uterequi]
MPTADPPIRILIADDQALVRGALAALLGTEKDMVVVAQTGTGADVVELARTHLVDVALLDIEMPDVDGIAACAALTAAGLTTATIIVTTFGRPGYLRRALASGATGFVVKDTPPDQLAEAIRRVARGLRVIDPTVAEESLFTPDSPLSPREEIICRLVLAGASTADIAHSLHLTQGTVRNHFSAIIAKTNSANRFEAASTARDNGWL